MHAITSLICIVKCDNNWHSIKTNIITHANVHDLLWSVYNRCKAGADAFARGMNDVLGMFDVVAANAAAYMPLFVHADEPDSCCLQTFVHDKPQS